MNIGKKSVSFNLDHDIPSLEGKAILVTGGNTGLGNACVLAYARHQPAQIWLVARSLEKAKQAAEEAQKQLQKPVDIRPLEMDLASMQSIQRAAKMFIAAADRLDILMLNAGIMAQPPSLTTNGYELQFGTNFLGHALLTKLLLPVLEKTAAEPGADVRIITLSSHGHIYAPKPEGVNFESLKSNAADLTAYTRYGQSKLAAILWARHMAKQYPQLTVASIHPGVVKTELMNRATATKGYIRVLAKITGGLLPSPAQGIKNQIWASVGKNVKSGAYYEPVGILDCETNIAKDDKLAEKLWSWTEKELQSYNAE